MKILAKSLSLSAPTSQNGQTHSNNLSAICLSVFDHFVGLALKRLSFVRVKWRTNKVMANINNKCYKNCVNFLQNSKRRT